MSKPEPTPAMMRLGYERYEALRRVAPRVFFDIYDRNVRGERFDDMVDEIVAKFKRKENNEQA